MTHQAREWYSYGAVPYVDMCAPCLAKTPEKIAAVARAKHEEEVHDAKQNARHFITSGAAQTALLAAGVQPVKLYYLERRWEWKRKGIFRRYRDEETEVVIPIGGWLLGMFKWEYSRYIVAGHYDTERVKQDWLTALLALDTLLGTPYVGSSERDRNDRKMIETHYLNYPFARVKPSSGGYEVLNLQGDGDAFRDDWLSAAGAVKGLMGVES
jgi:hypothetical protein